MVSEKKLDEKELVKIIDQLLKPQSEEKKSQSRRTNSPPQQIENINQETESNNNDQQSFMPYVENYNTNRDLPGHTHPDIEQLPCGHAWIKDNGIYVEGLPGHNILPSIKPTKGVNLFINNKLVKNNTVVSEHDNICVEFQTQEKPFVFKIHTSKDGLTGYMSIQLPTETKYTLVDQPPKQYLSLLTTTSTRKYCPIDRIEILSRIENERIKYGVDYPAIQQFLTNPEDGKYIIARGVAPTDSSDDVVDMLFSEKVIRHQYSTNDKIDFLNFKSIPSVDAGNLLAIKREGEMGQSGMSVFREIILPREPRKILVRAGKGARVEGNMVFSTVSGRPMVKRMGLVWLFYIEPYLRHLGDINLSTGNQNFRGNIEIFGDVCDRMTVRAGGNIRIIGTVNHAKVIAMESVFASKCIGALVQAGGDSHYIGSCYTILKELHVNLKGLSKVVSALLDNPKLNQLQNQLAQIILLLIEKKFTRIPQLLKDAVHFLEITPVDMPAEITTIVEMIKEHVPPRNLTPNKLKILIEYVEMAQNYFTQLSDTPGDLQVDYAFNSTIAATNNVHIAGQGCFNSKITAGRDVFINGIIRGGGINTKGTIIVEEAGSEIGSRTILQSESGKIKILNKIHDGVIIKIGERRIEITKTMGPVEFRKDGNGQISIINI